MKTKNDKTRTVGRRRGSMLAEICIAIVVASVALIAMLGFFTTTLQSVFAARDAEASSLMAVEAISDMECRGFAEISCDERIVRDRYQISRTVQFFTVNGTETGSTKDAAYAEVTVCVKREGSQGNGFTMGRRISSNAHRNVGDFK